VGGRDRNAGAKLAADMVRRCSDEALIAKSPEELTSAYGIPVSRAESVLHAEKWRRKIGG
jgi:hypothetical protein